MHIQMGVSVNGGTPKSSIFSGFSTINHPFWGNHPYFWKHPNGGSLGFLNPSTVNSSLHQQLVNCERSSLMCSEGSQIL